MSGTAGPWSFVIEQGADFRRVLTWKDDADAPINLTGFAARLEVRPDPDSSQVLLSMADGDGITLGGILGTITLALTAAETDDLDFAAGAFYDLELESAGGIVTRLLEGRVRLSPQVTR